MDYRSIISGFFSEVPPDILSKCTYSGALTTDLETSNMMRYVVLLHKKDMSYIASSDVDPDDTFEVHAEPNGYDDTKIVALLFDSSDTYNADILNSVSLCTKTFVADDDEWNAMTGFFDSITKTQELYDAGVPQVPYYEHDFRVKVEEIKPVTASVKSTVSYETLKVEELYSFVFDTATTGHFELDGVATAPLPEGATLSVPGRINAIEILQVTATDGSSGSVTATTPLETTQMTEDFFGDGSEKIASSLRGHFSANGGHVFKDPDPENYPYGNGFMSSTFYKRALRSNLLMPGINDGNLTYSFTIDHWGSYKANARPSFLGFEKQFMMKSYNTYLQSQVYNNGSGSYRTNGSSITIPWAPMHIVATLSDSGGYRSWKNGAYLYAYASEYDMHQETGTYVSELGPFFVGNNGQVGDSTAFRDVTISDVRVFYRNVSDAEALSLYNDTVNKPEGARYFIESANISVVSMDGVKPACEDTRSTLAIDLGNGLADTTPPTVEVDDVTFPAGEEYAKFTVSSDDVPSNLTDFPLDIRVNKSEFPFLFNEAGSEDVWKNWKVSIGGTQAQTEVRYNNCKNTLKPITVKSFKFHLLKSQGSSVNYCIAHMCFYDSYGKEIPYDEKWVTTTNGTVVTANNPDYMLKPHTKGTPNTSYAYYELRITGGSHLVTREVVIVFPDALDIASIGFRNSGYGTSVYSDNGVRMMDIFYSPANDLAVDTTNPVDTERWMALHNLPVSKVTGYTKVSNTVPRFAIERYPRGTKKKYTVKSMKISVDRNYGGSYGVTFELRRIRLFNDGRLIPYSPLWECAIDEAYYSNSQYKPEFAFYTHWGADLTANAYNSAKTGSSKTGLTHLIVTFPEPIEIDLVEVHNGNQSTSSAAGMKFGAIRTHPTKSFIGEDYTYKDFDKDIETIYEGRFAQHSYEHGIHDDCYNCDPFSEFALLTVKVPTLSSSVDTEILIDRDTTDHEAAGYIGETGSTEGQAVYGSDYTYIQNFADPITDACSLRDSSPSEGLFHPLSHFQEGYTILANDPDQVWALRTHNGLSMFNTPSSLVGSALNTVTDMSVVILMHVFSESTNGAIAFSLGDDSLIFKKVSDTDWAVRVGTDTLSMRLTDTQIADKKTMVTIVKDDTYYSLYLGGTLIDTAESTTENPVVNDDTDIVSYISARSLRINIDDTYEGDDDWASLRKLQLFRKGVLHEYSDGATWTPYQSSYTNNLYYGQYVFQETRSLIGADSYTGWRSAVGSITDQALVIDFGQVIDIDAAKLSNGHNAGGSTGSGIKNFSIDYSEADVLTATHEDTSGSPIRLYTGVLDEHIDEDLADLEKIKLDDVLPANENREYVLSKAFKFLFYNNFGYSYMSVRNITFFYRGEEIPFSYDWITDETSYYNTSNTAEHCFRPDLPRTGPHTSGYGWTSLNNSNTNQAITVEFPEAIKVDEIRYCPGHNAGNYREMTPKMVDILSTPSGSFDVTWGNDSATDVETVFSHAFEVFDYSHNGDNIFSIPLSSVDYGEASYLGSAKFVGDFSRLHIVDRALTADWLSTLEKSFKQTLITSSELSYGTSASEYVHYAMSFDGGMTYSIWTGTIWKPVVSIDPSVHGDTGVDTWHYREAGTTWTECETDDKKDAFSMAVEESTNRMDKTDVNALTSTNYQETDGYVDGNFDMLVSVYKDSTVESVFHNVDVNASDNVWVGDIIDLEVYENVVSSSVDFEYSVMSSADLRLSDTSLSDQNALITKLRTNASVYSKVTGGVWESCTLDDAIPDITASMDTTGLTLQFKIEYTNMTERELEILKPKLCFTISTF